MKPPPDASPEAVATVFLAALDEERWTDAAGWLHPGTTEAIRARQQSERAGTGPPPSPQAHRDGPSEMRRARDVAEAEALSAEEAFARFAETLAPSTYAGGAPLRLRRIVVDMEETASVATARYRTEVLMGNVQLTHFPWWNDVRELLLAPTPDGWRVRDVNLGPARGGSLLLPDLLRAPEGR